MVRKELLRLLDRAAAEGWKELDLSGYRLTEFPDQIANLVNLTELHRVRNEFSTSPEAGQLVHLKKLSLSRNQLTQLPKSIDSLVNRRI
jgi:internalin A